MSNIYFELTRRFNALGDIAILGSGQAAVHYRIAIMSKDGDWILKEDAGACGLVLDELAGRGATYRPGAPLDTAWLSGGWSSHFQFADERGRRVRCDFFSRPPRLGREELAALFAGRSDSPLCVLDIDPLIRMKRTQRAKDYVVIGELARLLPPEHEIELTTDPDRIIELAADAGASSSRAAVACARAGGNREAVAVELAREINALQEADRTQVAAYRQAAESYLREFGRTGIERMPLGDAHRACLDLARRLLPCNLPAGGTTQP
jgi:hypothetical protein